MRRPVRVLVAAAAPVALVWLGACSSSSTPLAQLTSSATSTSATASPTTSGTPTSGSTATPSGTVSLPDKATTVAQPFPASVTGDAKDAADAYVAYWTFITTAGSDPQGTDITAGVGKVATGKASSSVAAQLQQWATQGVHLIGSLTVGVTTATVDGTSAVVCGPLQDVTVTADASGKPTRAVLPNSADQRATVTKQGPSWRVSEVVQVESC